MTNWPKKLEKNWKLITFLGSFMCFFSGFVSSLFIKQNGKKRTITNEPDSGSWLGCLAYVLSPLGQFPTLNSRTTVQALSCEVDNVLPHQADFIWRPYNILMVLLVLVTTANNDDIASILSPQGSGFCSSLQPRSLAGRDPFAGRECGNSISLKKSPKVNLLRTYTVCCRITRSVDFSDDTRF